MNFQSVSEKIILKTGLLVHREHELPLSSVIRVTVKRSPIMRLFKVKEIEIFTKTKSFKLFMSCDEPLVFLPDDHYPNHYLRPGFWKTAFGAFIDVRALGGIAVFALTIRRLGTVFGSRYLDRVSEALSIAAENVEQALSALRVYIPRAAAAVGVFALAAWVFAYLKRLASISRFWVGRASKNGQSLIVVKCGLVTLYEHVLVPNSPNYESALMICDSPFSLFVKRAPLYLQKVMVYPAAERKTAHKLVRILSGKRFRNSPDTETVKPPKTAWFGWCAMPFGWSVGFAAVLFLMNFSAELRSAALLKTALYCGLFVSLYTVTVYLYYMRWSGIKTAENLVRISYRKSMRLYTAFVFGEVIAENVTQNIFQRRSGLCNFLLSTAEPRRIKARLLNLNSLNKISPNISIH